MAGRDHPVTTTALHVRFDAGHLPTDDDRTFSRATACSVGLFQGPWLHGLQVTTSSHNPWNHDTHTCAVTIGSGDRTSDVRYAWVSHMSRAHDLYA